MRFAILAVLSVLFVACASPVQQPDPFAAIARASDPARTGPTTRVYVSDIDTPAYRTPEDPRLFALVVGIERYQSLPEAQFAERDASAVREHLLALGFPERNILLLTGKQAGKAAIKKYLDSWLPINVPDGARLLFYFSGHGAPAADSGQAYIVPYDGDPEFLDNTAIPMNELYERLQSLKAREVVVAMDACFSGAGGRSVLAKGTRPLVTNASAKPANGAKLVVLTASGPDEITGSDQSQGHGLFTYHLLRALNDRKGRVTIREAYDVLRPKVADAARRQNRDQTAQLFADDSERAGIRINGFK